jgi:predicted DNA-binding protein
VKRTLTFRIADELRARLERSAEDTGVSPTTLIQRLIDEGLRMQAHPG